MEILSASYLKLCRKCGVERPISEFVYKKIASHGNYAYCSPCKPCRYIQIRNWQKKNPETVNGYAHSYYKANKSKCHKAVSKYKSKFHLENPWWPFFYRIRQRCNDKNKSNFKYYGEKGIKCLITIDELKRLWFRDRAYLMKKPSIDRMDPGKHYEISNCRFIEHSDNIRRRFCNSI